MVTFNFLMQQMNNPQHMMDGWGGFGMTFMIIFWVLIVALIITLIWFLVQKGSSNNKPSNESALDILKKRYSRGEIDEEEYQRIKKQISN